MSPESISARLQALAAKLEGRPRWHLSDNRRKALFCKRPGEVEEIEIPPPGTPLATHTAAEAHFQTEALFLIAANLERIATALEARQTTNPERP